MKDKYILEIYYPTTGSGLLMVRFASEMPFQAISQGDVIDASELPDADHTGELQVASVKHVLWASDAGESRHLVRIYAEIFDDTDDTEESDDFDDSGNGNS